MPALLYEKRGEIAHVTLNRPEVHNAMDSEVMVRLADAWQAFAAQNATTRYVSATAASRRGATASGADGR